MKAINLVPLVSLLAVASLASVAEARPHADSAAPARDRADSVAPARSHTAATAAPTPAGAPATRTAAATAPVAITVELDRPVQPAGQSGLAVIKVSLVPEKIHQPRKRPPVNLAIALDRSGSMHGKKIIHAREAALEALGMLGPQDRIALVTYDQQAQTLIESQPPLEREHLSAVIRGIRPGGTTALYAGVEQAAAEVRRGARKGSVNRVILLSDGQANVGPASPAALRRLGRTLGAEDISVSSVGLGDDFNEDLMTGIAEAGQGNSYFVENARDLSRIFEAELSDVLSVAATEVMLTIEFPQDVRPVRVIGRHGQIEGRKASFDIRQLMSGQKKFALIEVEVPHGKPGHKRTIADVNVNYTHAPSRSPRHQRARAEVSYSESEEAVRRAANSHVARAVVDNRMAMAQREAITLSDAGQNRQAAALMRKLNAEVTEMNTLYRDAGIDQRTQTIDQSARQLEQSRLSNRERKNYLNRSYQTVNQQRRLD